MTATRVRIAHSPDSDDAFMFYALTQGLLDVEGLAVEHVLKDIETLNQAAFEGTYEITALSLHGYAHLADRYALMPSGASFGDGYGPVVVSREPATRADLAGGEVAIPGELTTAHLALRLWQPRVATTVVPFDRILEEVAAGRVAAGVVIHEGQLTYGDLGLEAVVDLGAWWTEETGGPLPLGANGIRKDLAPALQRRLCRLLRESIDYALEPPRRGAGLRPPLRPRHRGRRRAQRPVRRHVRQRLDPGVRGRGQAGGPAAAGPGPRSGPHPAAGGGGVRGGLRGGGRRQRRARAPGGQRSGVVRRPGARARVSR